MCVIVNSAFRIDRKAWASNCYASLYARSSTATSSFTIVIMASITALTFLGSLSWMSSMNRLGTICQERPNASLIQPHAVGFAPALTSLSQYSSTSFWASHSTDRVKRLRFFHREKSKMTKRLILHVVNMRHCAFTPDGEGRPEYSYSDDTDVNSHHVAQIRWAVQLTAF